MFNAGTTLNAATYQVTAIYKGTSGFNNSTSTGLSYKVTRYAFTYDIASDSQIYGTPAKLATDLGTTIPTGVNGENLDVKYSSSGNTVGSDVGTYSITGNLSNGKGLISNYSVALKSGTLSVKPDAFTYAIANDSQTYGIPVNLAADLGTTIPTGVTGQNLEIEYSSTGDTAAASVGGYPITAALSNGTGQTRNYSVTLDPGTLTVTPTMSVTSVQTVKALQNISTGSVLLATFNVNSGSTLVSGNFRVSIDWKDGSPWIRRRSKLGTVNGSQVMVYGSHDYGTSWARMPVVTLTYLSAYSITATPTVNAAADATSQTSNTKTAWSSRFQELALFRFVCKYALGQEHWLRGHQRPAWRFVLTGLSGATLQAATVTLAGQTYSLAIAPDSSGDPVVLRSAICASEPGLGQFRGVLAVLQGPHCGGHQLRDKGVLRSA